MSSTLRSTTISRQWENMTINCASYPTWEWVPVYGLNTTLRRSIETTQFRQDTKWLSEYHSQSGVVNSSMSKKIQWVLCHNQLFCFSCNRWWFIVADNDISVTNDYICYVAVDSFVLVAIDKGFWSQMTDSLCLTAIFLEDEIAKGYSEDQWRADDGDDQRWTTRKLEIRKYHIQTLVHK